MAHSLVVHCKRSRYDVYIGRGPHKECGQGTDYLWGNPFVLGKFGNRQQVIEKFEIYLYTKPYLLSCLPMLTGKILGCYCCPLDCHGDCIAGLANDASMWQRIVPHLSEDIYNDTVTFLWQWEFLKKHPESFEYEKLKVAWKDYHVS